MKGAIRQRPIAREEQVEGTLEVTSFEDSRRLAHCRGWHMHTLLRLQVLGSKGDPQSPL